MRKRANELSIRDRIVWMSKAAEVLQIDTIQGSTGPLLEIQLQAKSEEPFWARFAMDQEVLMWLSAAHCTGGAS